MCAEVVLKRVQVTYLGWGRVVAGVTGKPGTVALSCIVLVHAEQQKWWGRGRSTAQGGKEMTSDGDSDDTRRRRCLWDNCSQPRKSGLCRLPLRSNTT